MAVVKKSLPLLIVDRHGNIRGHCSPNLTPASMPRFGVSRNVSLGKHKGRRAWIEKRTRHV